MTKQTKKWLGWAMLVALAIFALVIYAVPGVVMLAWDSLMSGKAGASREVNKAAVARLSAAHTGVSP